MSKLESFYLDNIQQFVIKRKKESITIVFSVICLVASFFIYRSSYLQRVAVSGLTEVKAMQSRVKKLGLQKEELKIRFQEIAKNAQKSDLTTLFESLLKSVEIDFKSEWNAKMKSLPVPLVSKSIFCQTLQVSLEGLDLKKVLSLFQALAKRKELDVFEMEIISAESKFTVNLSLSAIRDKA